MAPKIPKGVGFGPNGNKPLSNVEKIKLAMEKKNNPIIKTKPTSASLGTLASAAQQGSSYSNSRTAAAQHPAFTQPNCKHEWRSAGIRSQHSTMDSEVILFCIHCATLRCDIVPYIARPGNMNNAGGGGGGINPFTGPNSAGNYGAF